MATGAVIEEVAQNLEEAAEVTRKLNVAGIGYLAGGLVVGAAIGFYFGRRWNKEKLRAEAFKEAELEILEVREFYRKQLLDDKKAETKIVTEKPDLEDIVEEKGYSGEVVEGVVIDRPLRPPVPVQEPPPVLPKRDYVQPGIAKRHVDREKDKMEGWDYEAEIAMRIPTQPYIIHQDEFAQNETEYSQVTYTYYAADNVLTDEDEEKIRNPDQFVGVKNLQNFGHGADDYHVLYIRNERLEIDFEVCLLAASYAETVQGTSSDGES